MVCDLSGAEGREGTGIAGIFFGGEGFFLSEMERCRFRLIS
jgi:hypothetical protein